MKILISGVTGLIGKSLALHLLKLNYDVVGLTRDPAKVDFLEKNKILPWNFVSALDPKLFLGIDAVVHLAGESVAGSRWTEGKKSKILSSRVDSTKQLVESIKKCNETDRPKMFICASAIGYYGDGAAEELTEDSKPMSSDFLTFVTHQWEQELVPLENLNLKVVKLRTGIVLSKSGGALEQMKPVILGNGNQWMSWIHLEDEVRFIEFALKQKLEGVFNLVSPNPIQNKNFTKVLAKFLKTKIVLSVPKLLLKIVLGEFSEVLFASQKIIPKRTLESGFKFKYETLDQALDQIFLKSVVIEDTSSRST